MKRTIFLSLPMKDREAKDIMNTIDKMKTVIRAMYPDDDLTFIDNFTCSVKVGDGLVNGSLLYLGEAIKKMAYCDHIARICMWGLSKRYHGCEIEVNAADRYGLKFIDLNDPSGEVFLPDIYKKIMEEQMDSQPKCECGDQKVRG